MRYLSLFSGIEAASAAWAKLGWTCVALAEIEPGPCSVLAARHPGVPNLGDVTKIGLCALYEPAHIKSIALRYPKSRLAAKYIHLADLMESIGEIDLVVFGSPCQDLSVAGKRRGFTNDDGRLTRSGLFYVAVHIIKWARKRGCRFALWENVPGAFTSSQGRDFAAVVGTLAGLDAIDVPPKGWGYEGAIVGDEAMVEWAVLDAQWFGVAQRRRRVFALADFGDWSSRRPILLEPQGLRGDSPPSREKGSTITHDVAPCLTSSGRGVERGGDTRGQDPVIAVPVDSNGQVLQPSAFGGNNTRGAITVATAVNAHGGPHGRLDFESETFVCHPVVSSLDASYGRLQGCSGQDLNHGHSHLIPQMVTAVRTNAGGSVMVQGDCAESLATFTDPTSQFIAYGFQPRIARNGRGDMGDVANALNAQSGETGKGDAAPCVAIGHPAPVTYQWRVRRLTEIECERLQGYPDNHTLVKHNGKWLASGPRYKAIGNSKAVPVVLWIGRQIEAAVGKTISASWSDAFFT